MIFDTENHCWCCSESWVVSWSPSSQDERFHAHVSCSTCSRQVSEYLQGSKQDPPVVLLLIFFFYIKWTHSCSKQALTENVEESRSLGRATQKGVARGYRNRGCVWLGEIRDWSVASMHIWAWLRWETCIERKLQHSMSDGHFCSFFSRQFLMIWLGDLYFFCLLSTRFVAG